MAMCICKPNLFRILCVEEAQAEDFSSERTQQSFSYVEDPIALFGRLNMMGYRTTDGRLLDDFGRGGDVMETLPLRKIISFLVLRRPSQHASFPPNLALFTSSLL